MTEIVYWFRSNGGIKIGQTNRPIDHMINLIRSGEDREEVLRGSYFVTDNGPRSEMFIHIHFGDRRVGGFSDLFDVHLHIVTRYVRYELKIMDTRKISELLFDWRIR
jgi:hypothetical protein